MPVLLKCLLCEKEFNVKKSRKETAKYCSVTCRIKSRKTAIFINCDNCKKKYKEFLCQINKSNKHFCSNKCKQSLQKGCDHPMWKGGSFIDGHGYRYVKYKNKYKYEHRIVMEKFLKRELLTEEHVHHINENKLDNRIENFELLSRSDHAKKHHYPLSKDKWSREYACCVECSTCEARYNGHGLCRTCYMRKYRRENNYKA